MSTFTDEADAPLARIFWGALGRADRLIGVKFARFVAALILRATSRTRSGYVRTTYRLVERRDVAPGVVRLPSRWWNHEPRLSVRRLGLRFALDLRDNLQRVLYFAGAYEPDVLARIESILHAQSVVLDCGAHIGVHALPVARTLAKLGTGCVYAFEPSNKAADVLEAAAVANGLKIEVVRLALSDSDRELTLRTDDRYGDSDLGLASEFGSGTALGTVRTSTLDAWVQKNHLARLDAIKIDIEGGELSALRGMERTLSTLAPRLLIVETKEQSLERAGVSASQVREFLNEHGYRLETTVPFSNDIFVSQ